ncbi:MAG: hypothetical protein WDM86_14315 [Rhizomicrobium sp.]
MKRIFLAATAATLLTAAPAFAGDDLMANYLGNTVVSTGGMTESHTHYKADHSFDLVGSMMGMSKTFSGTWEIKGGQLCRTYVGEQPPGLPSNPFCTPWEAHKVGDTWTMSMGGNTRNVTLKAGIQ